MTGSMTRMRPDEADPSAYIVGSVDSSGVSALIATHSITGATASLSTVVTLQVMFNSSPTTLLPVAVVAMLTNGNVKSETRMVTVIMHYTPDLGSITQKSNNILQLLLLLKYLYYYYYYMDSLDQCNI